MQSVLFFLKMPAFLHNFLIDLSANFSTQLSAFIKQLVIKQVKP